MQDASAAENRISFRRKLRTNRLGTYFFGSRCARYYHEFIIYIMPHRIGIQIFLGEFISYNVIPLLFLHDISLMRFSTFDI